MSVLGIDTSNYTTSAAKCADGSVTANLRRLLPVPPGEKGLRQSDAVFHHTRQLPELLTQLLPDEDLNAIGVSTTPTTADGSYMPCFLVGKGAAQVLGAALNIPVYFFSHQQGHIAAALYSTGELELFRRRFLAFHVSGGTTEALLVSPGTDSGPLVQPVAKSLDLKAGQAVDRVGVALGLPFPCGPELEKLALHWQEPVSVRPVLRGADCSLSGIENQCLRMIREGRPPQQVARHCIESLVGALREMCRILREEMGPLPVVFSGGVSSNGLLRERLSGEFGARFAAPEFSADNAAGLAVLAALTHQVRRERNFS